MSCIVHTYSTTYMSVHTACNAVYEDTCIRGFLEPMDKMAAPNTALSDWELRAELKRLGFSAGPVTDTTRQVYLKKLEKLKAEERSKARAPKPPTPGRKLLGFSSDESDGETASNRRRSMPVQSKSLRRRSTKVQPQTAYNGTAEEYGNASPRKPTLLVNSSARSKRYSTGMMMPSVRSTFTRLEQDEKRDVSMRGRPSPSRGVISHSVVTLKSTKRNEFSDSDEGSDKEEEDMEDKITEDKPKSTKACSTNTTNPFNQTYTKYDDANDSDSKTSSSYWWSTTKPSPRRSLPASSPRTSTPRKFSSNRLRLSDAYNDEVDASKLSTTQNNSNILTSHPQNDVSSRYPNSVARSSKLPPTSSSSFLNSKSNHTPLPVRDQSNAQPLNSKSSKMSSVPYAGKEEDLFEDFATEDRSASSLGARIGHHIPMILLSCAFLFFVILAMVYMNVGSGSLEDLKYIEASGGPEKHMSEETRHKEAMRIVQVLYDKLSDVAGKYECGSQDVTSRNLSAKMVQAFLKHEFKDDLTTNRLWLMYHYKDALQKIINNPQWGVRLYSDNDELLANSKEEPMDPLDLEDQTEWLESTSPQMSFLCRVRRSASLVLFRSFLLCLVVLILWLVYKYVMYQIRRDREDKKQVHHLVDSITEMLAIHHKACSKDSNLSPYLAIPHVRDTLIPLKYRKEKQHLWDHAVNFINTHESRVRVETQQVAGEEFLVWRWMLPSPVVSSFTPITELELNPNRVKVWQGTAFDNLDTAIKTPRYSPTPCLKIRNMFDPTLESDGDWHVAIEDAVLERCGDNGGIVHVAVDKTSREGCVYVKCCSPQCAGQAYKALQGSWFDGKLVTVKYLRLERYHQRFPSATDCNTPIWPSNNLKRSLSHQNQSSSLEAS